MPEYVITDSKTKKQRCKTYKTMLISSRFCFETMKPILSRFLFDAIGLKISNFLFPTTLPMPKPPVILWHLILWMNQLKSFHG